MKLILLDADMDMGTLLNDIPVLKRLAEPGCRDGWNKFKSSCYLIALQPATWAEAESFCMAADGTLVEIESQDESDFLEEQLRNRHGNKSTLYNSYWIGGNDVQVEGDFRWYRTNSPLTYTDWNPGQPDDASTNEDCMELQGIFSYHWNDMDCTRREHFISSADCRDGWVKFHGSCYLIALQQATWAEAEFEVFTKYQIHPQIFCIAANSQLVEIETKIESDFLEAHLREQHRGSEHPTETSTLANSYWIGGNDIQNEGIFKWYRSDTDLTFTDWNPGQPDDAGTNEDCMDLQGIFSYHWNDHNCDVRQHFICEAK
ncbi:hypothetical protein FSP39_003936 [Pinctada imbricata]|uniref:C-type lectin domain-containing protein n=1 Tax=Pinctada imbricata TaxID=66713 RepID=A0AA88YIS5_PINIB|nr:hypothetical protein FSP39_003936 [Pinctada imbricata]